MCLMMFYHPHYQDSSFSSGFRSVFRLFNCFWVSFLVFLYDKQQLRAAIERLIRIFKSRRFQALLGEFSGFFRRFWVSFPMELYVFYYVVLSASSRTVFFNRFWVSFLAFLGEFSVFFRRFCMSFPVVYDVFCVFDRFLSV